MKKIIILLVIIAIVLIGYRLLTNKPTKNTFDQGPIGQINQPPAAPTTTPAEQLPITSETEETVTIQYADVGFEPKTLTVPTGTMVTFINESTSPLWVASDPHPTHTKLPEFDQKTSIPKGESYSFMFTKKGAWEYHNHRLPAHTGTIVVE